MQAEFDRSTLERELENEKNKIMMKEQKVSAKKRERDKRILEQTVGHYVPLITESNLICRELKRDITFSPYLGYMFCEGNDEEHEESGEKVLMMRVKVDNHERGYFYYWDMEKFQSRYYMIKDRLDDFFETNEYVQEDNEQDPFWDPPEPILLGQGYLKLMSLAFLLDNPSELILVGDNGQIGTLNVSGL